VLRPIPSLDALAELERRYNGPIPEPMRLASRHGSEHWVHLLQAYGQAAFFTAMVRAQLATIRRRRAEGSAYPALVEDLTYYRRERRRWRAALRTLRASAAAGGR
jgi:hypothetical protein